MTVSQCTNDTSYRTVNCTFLHTQIVQIIMAV